MLNSNLTNEIISCETFDEARTLFIEFCQSKEINKKQKIEMLDLLQYKVQSQSDVCILIDFYERYGTERQLLKYVGNCDFKDEPVVKRKIISVYRNHNMEEVASGLLQNQPNDASSLVQKAANLNKLGYHKEARDLIEPLLLKVINKYIIKAYASIINNLTKNDDYANQVLLPNIARTICWADNIEEFSINLFLKRLYKYENNVGNKKRAEIVEQILENFYKETGFNSVVKKEKEDFLDTDCFKGIVEIYRALITTKSSEIIYIDSAKRHGLFLHIVNKLELFNVMCINNQKKIYKILGVNSRDELIIKNKKEIVKRAKEENFEYTIFAPVVE